MPFLAVIYLVFLGAVALAGVLYTTVTHNVGTFFIFYYTDTLDSEWSWMTIWRLTETVTLKVQKKSNESQGNEHSHFLFCTKGSGSVVVSCFRLTRP